MTRRYIPDDVKEQIVSLSAQVHERKAVARLLDVSPRTVSRVLRLVRTTGKVVRRPDVVGRKRILSDEHVDFLSEYAEAYPDITLAEMRDELRNVWDVDVSIATILRAMQRRGFVKKKLSPQTMHWHEDVHYDYMSELWERYEPDQLVFVDASALHECSEKKPTNCPALHPPAPRYDYYLRGQRFSVMPAISLDGVLHLDIRDYPHTTVSFTNFIEEVVDRMQSYPGPNSVLVLENLDAQFETQLREMVKVRGARLECLPHASDLSPLSATFFAIEAQLMANYPDLTGPKLEAQACDSFAILQSCVQMAVTPVEVESWYQSCVHL